MTAAALCSRARLDHLARVHARAVNGASEHGIKGDEPVPIVQVQHAEDLVLAEFELTG